MSPSDEIERLSELARSGAESDFGEGEKQLLRARFLERAEIELTRPEPSRMRLLWALPALAAAIALAVWALLPRSLDFEVAGAPREGAYVRAPRDRPATVRFSDQTTLIAAAGSRLRVEEASARRARVLVERGRADVHVVHAALRSWTFTAGPFEVLVVGTRFVLDWEPLAETCELSVTEGAVEVRGPTGSGPVVVRAGQRLHADAQRRSMLVSDITSRAEQPSAQKAETQTRPAPPGEPAGASAEASVAHRSATSPGEAKPDTWQQRITRGEFKSIVAEAEERGVENCLSACTSQDLRALSDAARYTGRADLAEQSLLALRKRFASAGGRDAAFLLGRLEERRGGMARAQSWYDTYLREAPSGDFAAEALAGKMRAVKSLQGKQAAAVVAREYLTRFPKGVHVSLAREILETK